MNRRIVAVVTATENPALLPHFVKHYVDLGVDSVHVVICDHLAQKIATTAREVATQWPSKFRFREVTPGKKYSDGDKWHHENEWLKDLKLDPQDCVLHLDLDEFHQYPVSVPDLVRMMDEKRIDAIRSWFFDRASADGLLPAVRPDVPLGQQYPWGCYLTANLLQAHTQKIMLCRRRLNPGCARHEVLGVDLDRTPVVGRYCVHHFKWTGGVIERLERRNRERNLSGAYHWESDRFLDYWKKNGRIVIKDPLCNAWVWCNGMKDE